MVKCDERFILRNSMPIVFLLLLAGCAPVISKQVRDQIRPDITFKEVQKDPERYRGQMIILSGAIIEAKNTPEGTLLKVLQRPAGFRGRPKDVGESEGRFLALDSRYLDVTVYAKDRAVTIAGEIQGKRILPLDETQYAYTLIRVTELYLWPVIEERYYYSPYPYYYNDYWWRHRHFRRFRRFRKSCQIQSPPSYTQLLSQFPLTGNQIGPIATSVLPRIVNI